MRQAITMEIPEEARHLKNRGGHPSDTDAAIAAQALLDPDSQRLLAADTNVPAAAAGTDRGSSVSPEDLLDSFWQIRPAMVEEGEVKRGRKTAPASRPQRHRRSYPESVIELYD